MQQLPRQLPMCIEKKHYHVTKRVADVSLHGTQILYLDPMIFQLEHLSLVEKTKAHLFPRPKTGN